MIECPLLKKMIEDEICFDISMVSEELAPERTVPEEVAVIEGYKEICLSCKNHRED